MKKIGHEWAQGTILKLALTRFDAWLAVSGAQRDPESHPRVLGELDLDLRR